MATVKYTGRADARVLSARDLKLAGVEGFSKTTFLRRRAVEVDDEVAQALTENKLFGGEFQLVDEEEETSDEEAEASFKTPAESAEDIETPTTSGSTDTPGAGTTASTASSTGSTRRGSRGASTRGAR